MRIRVTFKKTEKESRARISRYEDSEYLVLGVLNKWRAELIVNLAFEFEGKTVRRYRDGRQTIEVSGDDKTLKMLIAVQVAKGMRSKNRLAKILSKLKTLTDQETRLVYALIMIYGRKAARAIRELLA